jgi:hypothetical protein
LTKITWSCVFDSASRHVRGPWCCIDTTRPIPEARTARMLADRAVQRAAGRVDPVASSDRLKREPGSQYIDFLIPGLLGMNLLGGAIWGLGFAIVDARRKKLMKRLITTPMPGITTCSRLCSRGYCFWWSKLGHSSAWLFGVPRSGPGFAARSRGYVCLGVAVLQRLGIADSFGCANHRGCFRS